MTEGNVQWSVEKARGWWAEQAWPVGCNFIPSTAVNQLEMWQADSFDSPVSEPVGEACLPLLRDVFDWARAAAPRQPLTSGLWWNPIKPVPEAIGALQRERSDVISFHHYGPADDLEQLCDRLEAESDRPLLCTEFLARNIESRLESHLPIYRDHKIGAICWGLVSGKTQTVHPWWSWFRDDRKPEPEVWFHDILHPDGTPFDEGEVVFLRNFTGRDVR